MNATRVSSLALRALVCLLAGMSFSVFGQNQPELNQMAAKDAGKADAELNRVYKKVLASLDDEGARLLREAQRAWIAYRDAEAKRAADEARGGSMAPMLYSGAIAELTQDRIKRLRSTLIGSSPADEPEPTEKPKAQKPVKKAEPVDEDIPADGAKTQAQAAQLFFDAYKAHDRKTAMSVAEATALDKLIWSKDAGDASGLRLMDNTHIYYEGGHIELKMKQNKAGRWLIGDVKLYAD